MKTPWSHRSFIGLPALLAAAALALGAPIASAQTAEGGYTPPGSDVQAEIQDSPTTPPSDGSTPAAATAQRSTSSAQRSTSSRGSALPFTGLDLGFVGAAGLGLVLVGFMLRRMTLRGGGEQPPNAA